MASTSAEIPSRRTWKRDVARYVEPDARRGLAQIATVVLPYIGVWTLAALVEPTAPAAVALGLVATPFLVRMYSLFHDLTHNSLFRSRRANRGFGHLLGFLLFTPYRWWQRQHSLHHAHTGNLDARGPGEIHTMTLAEYEHASRAILAGVLVTNLALAAWVLGWSAAAGLATFLLIQGTTLVAGGAIAAWMLYIQHQYEETYYQSADDWRFELAALQGSSYLRLPRALTWVVGNANYHHVHHLSAKIPNYRLRAAHEELPMFARTPVVTIRSGIAALRLKLWDEEGGRLVGYPPARARRAAPAERRERALVTG